MFVFIISFVLLFSILERMKGIFTDDADLKKSVRLIQKRR